VYLYVAPPKRGTIHYRSAGGGQPSPTIRVVDPPANLADEELAAFMQEIALHRLGLIVKDGDSVWPSVVFWPSLITQAAERGIEPPAASATKEKLSAARLGVQQTMMLIERYRSEGETPPPETIEQYHALFDKVARLEAEARK